MATNPPTGPIPIIPPVSPVSAVPLSWDGDRMFNVYIYDYCYKRGFFKTALALQGEAGLPLNSEPPINAKQGLLFEWWSVFWVLFTAKSSGSGTDDALAYTQHQAQQNAQRQAQARLGPQQAQPNRYTNGRTSVGAPTGTPMTNGVGHNGVPAAPGGPANGTAGSSPFPGGIQPVNGVSGPSHAPHGAGGSVGQPPTIGLMPGQRPTGGPPPRGPNGAGPFQSPTMAHSPQNPSTAGQQPNMGPMVTSQSLAQMSRGMPPPNDGADVVPSDGSVSQRARIPGTAEHDHWPQSIYGGAPAPGTAGDPRMSQEQAANQELVRYPPQLLNQLKQEAGLGDKDLPSLSADEKQRILAIARRRGIGKPNVGPQGPSNAAAGPSGSNQAMQHPGQPQRNPQMPGGPQPQQTQGQQSSQQQQRMNKRSTSPGPDHDQARNDSPPDRKRLRRSPAGQEPSQPPPMAPMMPYTHSGQPGGPAGTPQMPNSMMQRPMSFQGRPGMPNMSVQGMSMQSMGGQQITMSPGMMNHPGPGGMMNPQQQYRQTMHDIHKSALPHAITGLMPGGTGAAPSSDGQFNAESRPGTSQFPGGPGAPGANRMGQPKPSMAMMPPQSPGLNAPKKDAPGPSSEGGAQKGASPQNAAAGIGGQNQQGGSGGTPLTPSASGTNMAAPSPSAMANNSSTPGMGGSGNSVDSMAGGLFTGDFMGMSSMEDFDTSSIFRTDELNVNFDEWFNTDSGGLDLGGQ
ncbi:hypothetical protein B0H21DRAFT_824299 [Amylocystis lapponica]|nr:hypothetical protein B0H21DRAFT_824299 [Amylocystis lapponica]